MQNGQKSCYLVDWVSYTTQIDSIATVKDELGLTNVNWEIGNPTRKYKNAIFYENIKIQYNGEPGMGIWVEMTGQGCRAYETLGKNDYMGLFTYLTMQSHKDINITRIDIAFDDRDGLIDMDRLFSDTITQNFISRFQSYMYHGGSAGKSVEHGRKGSQTMIRIYDKAKERKLEDDTHWIRVELQLRKDRAREFASYYVRSGGNVNDVYMGVLNNYLRYVDPNEDDTNKWRWEMTDYWRRLTNAAESIQLFINPGMEYNYQNLENYIINQAGNALFTLFETDGVYKVFHKIKNRNIKLSQKYQRILDQCAKSEPIEFKTPTDGDYKDYRYIMQEQEEIPGLFKKELQKYILEEKAKNLAEKPEI